MTAGLIAVGKELIAQFRIQKEAVGIRSVDLGVTLNTIEFRTETAMHDGMSGRQAVTLQTYDSSGFFQQLVVNRAVGLMTFGTTSTLHQVIIYHRMLVKIEIRKIYLPLLE